MSRLTAHQLDSILALQLTVAWAGESAGEPPRLGWWKSDLVDREGGGDLFARLVPKTAEWASLGLVREVARRIDEGFRQKLPRPDAVWTLFHLGFSVDEQLLDRIAYHRQHRSSAAGAHGERFLASAPWSRGELERMLGGLGKPKVEITPAGRRIDGAGAGPAEVAVLLASALLPLGPSYPMPYVEVSA